MTVWCMSHDCSVSWALCNTEVSAWPVLHQSCLTGRRESVSSHLILVVVIVSHSLTVLVQLAHQHLPCAEIEGAEVHLVAEVTG